MCPQEPPRRPEPAKPGATPRPSLGARSPLSFKKPIKGPEDLLEQTARLMRAVFNEETQESISLQAVFKALERPGSRVVVELPWHADGGRSEIVLKGRNGQRMNFYNPLGHGTAAAGAELTDGLRRRVEADGTESCDLTELEVLFRLGKARALISPPLE